MLLGLAGIGIVGLSGCARLLGQAAPPRLYKLEPAPVPASSSRSVSWQLVVQTPEVAGGLDSNRIALTRPPFTLDYFAEAAWTDRVPVMVQSLIIEAFQNSGRILAVGRETFGLRSDYVLRVDIRDFEAEYADAGGRPPSIHARILCSLVRTADRSIVGQHAENRRVAATSNELDRIVAAFNAATSQALEGIVGWLLAVAPSLQPVVPVPQPRTF